MNCFYHPGVVSVGICKSCGKGLCPSCAVDVGQGLACSNRCEGDVQKLIRLDSYNLSMADSKAGGLRTRLMGGGIFFVGGGLIFVGPAFLSTEPTPSFMIPMGVLFLGSGIWMLKSALSLPK